MISERTVYISQRELDSIQSIEVSLNSSDDFENPEYVNVDKIVFGSMIQCGVEKFLISSAKDRKNYPQSNFLAARTTYIPQNKTSSSYKIVQNTFNKFLRKESMDLQSRLETELLENFITDLMVAVELQTSFMITLPIPNVDKYKVQLPPELMIPIRNLINSFETFTPSLPYPKSSIRSNDVNRFKQLIASDLYVDYALQHRNLEVLSIPKERVLANVIKSGRNIFQKNINILQLKELAVSVLPVTASLIDIVFGKLPGALADYSATLLAGILKNEKRIVVYQLNPILKDVIITQIQRHLKPLSTRF